MATLTRMYSSIEAAEVLGVTPSRVRQICGESDGKIGNKPGRDWFLSESDLELIRVKVRKYQKSGPDSD